MPREYLRRRRRYSNAPFEYVFQSAPADRMRAARAGFRIRDLDEGVSIRT